MLLGVILYFIESVIRRVIRRVIGCVIRRVIGCIIESVIRRDIGCVIRRVIGCIIKSVFTYAVESNRTRCIEVDELPLARRADHVQGLDEGGGGGSGWVGRGGVGEGC